MSDAIRLEPYDPAWVDRFEEQRARLTEMLAPWLAGPIEQIGSTAVPGLSAKPIVDVLAPVRSLPDARAAILPLAAEDWLFWPDDPNGGWRLWFLHPEPGHRTHHLHVIEHDHAQARALLAFRDVLRDHPDLRDGYAALKSRLADLHHDNRNAYTNAKADFLAEALRSVGVEPPPLSRLPE